MDGFRQSARDGLRGAAELGFRPIELSAPGREISPEALTDSGRRHLKRYIEGLGLSIAALGGDLGGRHFADSATLDERIDRTRKILEMAAELRALGLL